MVYNTHIFCGECGCLGLVGYEDTQWSSGRIKLERCLIRMWLQDLRSVNLCLN